MVPEIPGSTFFDYVSSLEFNRTGNFGYVIG